MRRFISLEELIRANLPAVFPGMDVLDFMPFRVTRSAAMGDEYEGAEDLLETVEQELRQRRLQHVVRLEHAPRPNRWLLDEVIEHLDLDADQVYEVPGQLDYTTFRWIASLPEPTLRYPTWTPVIPKRLATSKSHIFSRIRKGDVLVHHPFESFDASVARFLRAAVDDPKVIAIKMTVYRTSDDSPFVPLLIQRRRGSGKQVACLVELKARFDEHRNIRWANALVGAGVHVVYGVDRRQDAHEDGARRPSARKRWPALLRPHRDGQLPPPDREVCTPTSVSSRAAPSISGGRGASCSTT